MYFLFYFSSTYLWLCPPHNVVPYSIFFVLFLCCVLFFIIFRYFSIRYLDHYKMNLFPIKININFLHISVFLGTYAYQLVIYTFNIDHFNHAFYQVFALFHVHSRARNIKIFNNNIMLIYYYVMIAYPPIILSTYLLVLFLQYFALN